MKGQRERHGYGRLAAMALAVLVAIVALVLVADDATRLVAWLPWLLLAACPLMHIFMHRGHGQRHRDTGRDHADGATTAAGHRHAAGGES